jgi:hypothetical protein
MDWCHFGGRLDKCLSFYLATALSHIIVSWPSGFRGFWLSRFVFLCVGLFGLVTSVGISVCLACGFSRPSSLGLTSTASTWSLILRLLLSDLPAAVLSFRPQLSLLLLAKSAACVFYGRLWLHPAIFLRSSLAPFPAILLDLFSSSFAVFAMYPRLMYKHLPLFIFYVWLLKSRKSSVIAICLWGD